MMKPIFILGCGAKKQIVPCAARHLYTGPLFQAALAYALARSGEPNIRILSAKHGLVNLDAILAPYDATWRTGPCIGTADLAAQMPASWRHREFVLLCGADYRTALGYAYSSAFKIPMRADVPLEHLGIGQQVKWLRENTPQ